MTQRAAYNPGASPVVIDAAGHMLGGGEWAAVDPDAPQVARAVAGGRLTLIPDDVDTAGELSPGAAAAVNAVREANAPRPAPNDAPHDGEQPAPGPDPDPPASPEDEQGEGPSEPPADELAAPAAEPAQLVADEQPADESAQEQAHKAAPRKAAPRHRSTGGA